MFGLHPEDIDTYKNDPGMRVVVQRAGSPVPHSNHSFRQAVQNQGDGLKAAFGDTVLLDRTLPIHQSDSWAAIVVTDCRFQNEARRIRDLGGKIIRIDRPNLITSDVHISEVELLSIEVDHTIKNDSTILDLYERTERMLDALL